MSFKKVLVNTSSAWPQKDLNMQVFFRLDKPADFFLPVSSLGNALRVNGESIPSRFVSDTPADFALDKRVRNIVSSDVLEQCLLHVLDKKDYVEQDIQDMIQDITDALDSYEDKSPVAHLKRSRNEKGKSEEEEEEEVEPEVALLGELEIKAPVVHVSQAQLGALEDRIARRVMAELQKFCSYEAQQGAALMYFNSKEFQDMKESRAQSKLDELNVRTENAYAKMLEERKKVWEKELEAQKAAWTEEARAKVYDEVRRESLPKAQEDAIQEKIATSATKAFHQVAHRSSTAQLIANDELAKLLEKKK
jgi:hypothetical protein